MSSSKRPPVAWAFSRDTVSINAFLKTSRFRDALFIVQTAAELVQWLRNGTWGLELIYDPDHNQIDVLGEYETISDMEAMSWITEKLGRDFVEYAVELLVDKYERVGGVAELLPNEYDHGVAVDKDRSEHEYISRIDFYNRTIEIWHIDRGYGAFRVGEKEVLPMEGALRKLRAPWEAIKRVFAVGVVIRHHSKEVIRKVNEALEDKMVLYITQNEDITYNIKWGDRYEYYSIDVFLVKPEDVCIRVKLKDTPLNDVLSEGVMIMGENRMPMSSMMGVLSSPLYYVPFTQKGILFNAGMMPIDMTERAGRVYLQLGQAWIVLTKKIKEYLADLSAASINVFSGAGKTKHDIVEELRVLRQRANKS